MLKKILPFLILASALIYFLWPQEAPLNLAIDKEMNHHPLILQGSLPDWFQGSIIRNSAIPIFKGNQQISHELDGLAMLHGFSLKGGQLTYSNRFIASEDYEAVVKQKRADFSGFATRPTLFHRFLGLFDWSQKAPITNASVNVFLYGSEPIALTETPLPVLFDLDTLKTIKPYEYSDDLPKGGIWESAHPHKDAATGEIFNYYVEFGSPSRYVIYRMEGRSRVPLASIPVDKPSYMHSFAMTKNALILTEFPLVVSALDLITSNRPFIENFKWEPERGTRFTIVEKKNGQILASLATDPFFSFHHANAYEDQDDIVIDLAVYPNLSDLSAIFFQGKDQPKAAWKRRLMRYRVNLKNAKIDSSILLDKEIEFPRINDRLDGLKYQFLYLTEKINDFSSGLVKVDLEANKTKSWYEESYEALEPIFVPNPSGASEDDGIIITIINQRSQNDSFFIALDGLTFQEIARAKLPWKIPGSFHGQYFKDQ